MRKIIALLAILLISGSAYAYDDGGILHKTEESGGPMSDPLRVLQLVRFPVYCTANTGSAALGRCLALSTGDVVLWDTVSDDGVTVNVLGEMGVTESNDAVAGVVVGTIPTADVQSASAVADAGRRNWGYIQTYGLHPAAFIDASPITAGEAIRASGITRRAGASREGDSNNTNGGQLGFAYDGSVAAGSAEVFIRLR